MRLSGDGPPPRAGRLLLAGRAGRTSSRPGAVLSSGAWTATPSSDVDRDPSSDVDHGYLGDVDHGPSGDGISHLRFHGNDGRKHSKLNQYGGKPPAPTHYQSMPSLDGSTRHGAYRLGTLALLALLAATGTAGARVGDIGYTGGMMGGSGGWGFFGGGMFLWPLLLLGLLALLVYGLADGETNTSSSSDEAMAELRRRYARGELSDEEFDRRKRTLQRTD